jgi:cytochrome c oxidase assembly protein subunit 15
LMVIALAAWAWRALSDRPVVKYLGIFAVFTIIFQGLLGAASVVWKQPAWALALHFGISLICFASVLLLQVLIFRSDRGDDTRLKPVEIRIQRLIWGTALFSYVVVYLGAYVRHVKASLACVGWPLCNGDVVPTLSGQIGASFAHRVGAALLAMVVVWAVVSLRRHAAHRVDLTRVSYLALFLVLLQAASGALMALGYYNLLTQMLHSAIVTAFWGSLCFLSLQALPDLSRPGASVQGAKSHYREA